ncbi:hypothetical protein ACP70R_026107 [Stipagrostis hirtigluma subsp. patula]
MKTNTTHAALLLALLVLVVSSPGTMAIIQCTPERICIEFTGVAGACDPGKCFSDCVNKYDGKAEGQCFPLKGCGCSYCCDPRGEHTTA